MALFKVKAVPDFTQLKNELKQLSATPVKIHVDATEFTALSNQAIKTMNATARLTKVQNELAVAQEKTKQTANLLAAAQQKTTQTANQLATQMEKTAAAEEKARKANLDLSREIQKATTEQEKQKTSSANLALQQEKTATAGKNLEVQQEKTRTAAEKATGSLKAQGEQLEKSATLWDDIVKNAKWQILSAATSAMIGAFKDALTTMKSVDDEMVTIRKVTGATAEELQKLEAQAYETASAYGVAADEYLSSVSAFSRAGYGDQAAALAELATKTQIVGDTDAKTAQQFLLSVDAAYHYQGSIESLSRVLDGANEIDNKYATSIEKIAEGLGKVAPIASQAHVGVDELTAAIGTITAVTQRSGTEAATALRALFLNIIGDTKTEIDEGVTWTTGEIAGLRDVIKLYAKDAYDVAQVSGDVINPMKAIAGLAQSMKDGLLTEQQLMEMVSDIGGKLRTSQLLALIQNWDMYESMLGDYADSIGSADKEVGNALDSWSRKTEILKNKWTEFISHLVETDTIKGALDAVIGLVELLDTDVGHFIITVGALTTAVILLGQAKKWLAGAEVIKGIASLFKVAGPGVSIIERLATVFGGLNPVILAVTAGMAVLVPVVKALADANDKANRSMADFDAEIDETNGQLAKNKERLDEINATPWNERSSEIIKEKQALEKENEELEKKIELLKEEKLESAQSSTGEGFQFGFTEGEEAYATVLDYLAKYTDQIKETGEIEDEQRLAYDKTVVAAARQVEMLELLKENGEVLTEQEEQLIAAYELHMRTVELSVDNNQTLIDSYVNLTDAGYLTEEQYKRLISLYPELASAATQTADGYEIQKDALLNLMSAETQHQAQIQATVSAAIAEAQQLGYTGQAVYDFAAAVITASNTPLDVSQQIAALQAVATQAGYSAEAVSQVYAFAQNIDKFAVNSHEVAQRAGELLRSGKAKSISEALDMAKRQLTAESWGNLTKNYTPTITPSTDYDSGGVTTGKKTSTNSSSAARKRAQAAIKQLQKERDAELDEIQKQIDALQEQAEIEERQAKSEEYKLEILKKQDAVMNARNERTVRQYNASTGQWEWVADATKVKKAEEDLENAKKDLREYERQVELDIAVDELKARQEAIKAAYQIKIDAWQDYLDGLANAVADEAQYLAQSVANNKAAVDQIISDRERLSKDLDPDGDGKIDSPGGKDETIYSPSTASETDIKTMQAYLGVTPDGKWGTKSATALKNSDFASFDALLRYFYSDGGPLDKAVAAVKAGNSQAMRQYGAMKQSGYSDQISYASVARIMGYDEGGILKGMGGIKATPQDEIVLPPKLAARMLTPLADRTFKARLGELGFLYGAENSLPRTLTGSSDNRSYTDNSGTRYQIGSITMTEGQAKRTTIYEAAQLAHNLQAFSG